MKDDSHEELEELTEFIEPHLHHQVMRQRKWKLGFVLEDPGIRPRCSVSLVLVDSTDQLLPI
jgi:hypothetical protein